MRSLLLVAAATAAFAQPPSYEVATVKPSDPTSVMAIRRSGHRISTTATSLLYLITWAYDVHADRVYGKPNWLDSVRYDVVASAGTDRPDTPLVPGQPT